MLLARAAPRVLVPWLPLLVAAISLLNGQMQPPTTGARVAEAARTERPPRLDGTLNDPIFIVRFTEALDFDLADGVTHPISRPAAQWCARMSSWPTATAWPRLHQNFTLPVSRQTEVPTIRRVVSIAPVPASRRQFP